MLCLLSGVVHAKAHRLTWRAEEDREQARTELAMLQAAAPTRAEVCIMKQLINTGKVEQETLHAARDLPVEDMQRVAAILQEVRPNPHYVRVSGGHKRVGKRTRYSSPRLFLTVNGERRKFDIYAITATDEERKRWLLEEKLLEELLSIVERNAPECPEK